MAIRPCQRGLPTANSPQADASGEFAGTSSIAQRCIQLKNEMGKIDKILKKVLPPATREFRDGFDNKSIVDSLRESEKLALEKELIKLLPETNDLLIADTLAYLKSKEAIPILMEKMNTRLPDFEFPVSKILIATCIFEIDGSNKEMIQIVKDEFEKLEKSSYKGGMFYQLIKFRDESFK